MKKEELKEDQNNKVKKYRIEFTRRFTTDGEVNKEFNTGSDTVFHSVASFEKKYRWFYTYIRYSETFRPIIRFKLVSEKDYFNAEDSLFIQRLPAEGRSISKADSVYLDMLNQKITERFATMALFKEYFEVMEEVIRKNSLGKNWIDTLRKNKDFIYQQIDKGEGDFKFETIVDKLKIPLSKEKAAKDFSLLSKDITSRINFMSFAYDGKYLNEFEMPWLVTSSNADSVVANHVFWKPVVHKFLFRDYEMFAESRKINFIEVVISFIIVSLTAFVLWRSSKSQG
jgi:hypothetical protein